MKASQGGNEVGPDGLSWLFLPARLPLTCFHVVVRFRKLLRARRPPEPGFRTSPKGAFLAIAKDAAAVASTNGGRGAASSVERSPLPIRVVIAEDQRLLRQCFAQVLSADPDLEVVATASNGEEALIQTLDHRPDVVLMDLEMPVMDGSEATRLIHERAPATKVLMLSRHTSPYGINKAVQRGVHGYVLKDVPPAELIRIVKAMHRGEEVESPFLADDRLEAQREDQRSRFSPRELEMLRLLKEGMSNSEMAEALFVSEQTVKRDMMSVCEKLGVDNRTQAAVRVIQLGLGGEAASTPGPQPAAHTGTKV